MFRGKAKPIRITSVRISGVLLYISSTNLDFDRYVNFFGEASIFVSPLVLISP